MLASGMAPAATINVTRNCSLGQAIASANRATSAGECVKGGDGEDTIVLPSGGIPLLRGVNNDFYGPTGLPVIRSVITIDGTGNRITRAGTAPPFRLFAVGPSGDLTLQRLTLSGGVAPKAGSDISNDGGAVLNVGGILSIIDSTIVNNRADRGGGVQSQVDRDLANRATVMIHNTTIAHNTAVDGPERTSAWGGGMDVDGHTDLIIRNSTLSNNNAAPKGVGGGIYLTTGTTITMSNSTLTGNSAAARAGGIATGCATLDLHLNLISGNTAPLGSEMATSSPGCQTATLDSNLFGHSDLTNVQAFHNFVPGTSDITATSDGNTPAGLATILDTTLTDNGGLTRTHALITNSYAVDAATSGCPPPDTDQRGVTRPQDGNQDGIAYCDIGALELAAQSNLDGGPGGNQLYGY
jgi:hypothetical protein